VSFADSDCAFVCSQLRFRESTFQCNKQAIACNIPQVLNQIMSPWSSPSLSICVFIYSFIHLFTISISISISIIKKAFWNGWWNEPGPCHLVRSACTLLQGTANAMWSEADNMLSAHVPLAVGPLRLAAWRSIPHRIGICWAIVRGFGNILTGLIIVRGYWRVCCPLLCSRMLGWDLAGLVRAAWLGWDGHLHVGCGVLEYSC
jgi:hypothetical protein